uniref:Halictine-1 n=1 Tax=Halictus sexcinctus TaxID=115105 RepID=HAL1_HALST|nr:RecName: Full=Halictine-1; Short=HAL-1; AltName: Full=Halictin 1; AltName: Full=Halictine I [Halictus sexcinctus]
GMWSKILGHLIR